MNNITKKTPGPYWLSLIIKYKSFVRFAFVGGINTAVDFITFSTLYFAAGADKFISQVSGYTMGIINSFIMNKLWTFEASRSPAGTLQQLLRFILVNFLSLGISLLGLNYLSDYFGMNIYITKIIATISAQAVNYFGYKHIVFNMGQPRKKLS